MITFAKDYLEGIREKDSKKAINVLKTRIERKTGLQLHATQVLDSVIKNGKKVFGIFLMFADGKHALRFNWSTSNISSDIVSIDFWVNPSANPHYSVNVEELNIVEIVNTVDSIVSGIKNIEDEEIKDDSNDGGEFDDTEDSEVSESITRNYIKNKSFNEEEFVAKLDDYLIEAVALSPAEKKRRLAEKKKKEALRAKKSAEVAKRKKEYHAGVAKREKERLKKKAEREKALEQKRKAKAAGKSAKINAKGKITKAAVDEREELRNKEFDAMFEDPLNAKELFSLLEQGISDVASGRSKTMIITGDPGIGKTFTVTKELAGSDTEVFKGGITSSAALYKMLFINNKPGRIIIFDDLDTLFQDKESANILKGALDSSPEPEVSYISNNTVHPLYYDVLTDKREADDPEVIKKLNELKIDIQNINEKRLAVMKMKAQDPFAQAAILPNKFVFKSKVIFISNMYLDEIPEAIISRGGTKVEVNLTLDEIVNRINDLLDKIEVPVETGSKPIGMPEKKQAIEYLKKVLIPYGKIKKIEFRNFFDICRLASGTAPKKLWWRWASAMLADIHGIEKNRGYVAEKATKKRKKR